MQTARHTAANPKTLLTKRQVEAVGEITGRQATGAHAVLTFDLKTPVTEKRIPRHHQIVPELLMPGKPDSPRVEPFLAQHPQLVS